MQTLEVATTAPLQALPVLAISPPRVAHRRIGEYCADCRQVNWHTFFAFLAEAYANTTHECYLREAAKAAAAIRTMLGCKVPNLGFCPCGAWGGTEK